MKKKTLWYMLAAAAVYALLLAALTVSEQAAPQARIRNFGDALWYSLVTLTTVGYGDLYPVTPVGRAVGTLFLALSVGVLAALIGMAAAAVRGRLLPWLRLRLLRGKTCYVFSELNPASVALARDLLRAEPDARPVFCRARREDAPAGLPKALLTDRAAADIAAALPGCGVFLMADDPAANLAAASALRGLPCAVWCQGPETACLPDVRFFDAPECCARLYWQTHPLNAGERRVLLAGDGAYARALADQAALCCCRLPFQSLTLHLFGDWADYRRCHPGLLQVFGALEAEGQDAMIFHGDAWNADPALLETADRVIFCADDRSENAARAITLARLFPTSATAYALAEGAAMPAIAFGEAETLYTRELVMKSGLDARARALHAAYCGKTGDSAAWEALPAFLKASNRAAADHLLTKLRLLVPEAAQADAAACREAARRFRAADETLRDRMRRCEHERWMRFYCLYNWRCGPRKDAARRTHPCLVPYDQLSPAEQAKDDSAWEQLAELGEEERPC